MTSINLLNKTKLELKAWENQFVKSHDRKPSKGDIEAAGSEIISLYRQYDELKKASQNIPVWGTELNKTISVSSKNEDKPKKIEPAFRMGLGKKMVETALQYSKEKKTVKPPVKFITTEERDDIDIPGKTSLKISESFNKKPLVVKDQLVGSPLLAIQKSSLRNKFLTTLSFDINNSEPDFEATSNDLKAHRQNVVTNISNEGLVSSNLKANSKPVKDDINISSTETENSKPHPAVNFLLVPEVSRPSRPSTPVSKLHEFNEIRPEPACTEKVDEFHEVDVRSKKRKNEDDENSRSKKCKLDSSEMEYVDKNMESFEKEAVEDDSFNNKMSTSKTVTSRRSRPTQFSSGKISNDNFVRLNMKVKRYKRKGAMQLTGASARRQAWKHKMKLKFGDNYKGNSKNCFKCGQTGHWAKNCKSTGSFKPNMEGFDWTMGSQLHDDLSSNTDVFEKVNFGEHVSKALEEARFPGNVVFEKFEPSRPPQSVEALYELNEDGSVPETPKEVLAALKKFGFKNFKEGQRESMMRILCGKSTLVVLSTGSGKSLCYQLPAYLYGERSKSICLVISPLVSLMQDQVLNLPACLKGACIHNNMTAEQRASVLESASNGQLHFLLLSPEMLVGGMLMGDGRTPPLPPVSFACIDEVHCLSEWSHHFRPSYLMVCKVLRERFGVKCMLGLTATANKTTVSSICQHFDIDVSDKSVIRQAPVPKNLQVTISRDEDKDEMLIELLKGKRFSRCPSIIVYCTRREQTSRVATIIRTRMQNFTLPNEDENDSGVHRDDDDADNDTGKKKKTTKSRAKKQKPLNWEAECYHAGLTPAQRKRIQKNFMSGKLRVVVATVAFGMGLDKSDVRGIVHYNIPGTVESYVQEIGRAGRDGVESHCHLFLDPSASDLRELKRHIYAKSLDRITVKKFIQQIFKPCNCRILHEASCEDVDFEQNGDNMKVGGNEEKVCRIDQNSSDDNEGRLKEGENEEKTRNKTRICPGHERALSIEGLVQSLDVKEEGLATLLCYLELCPQGWIYNRQSVYSKCSLRFYSGPEQFPTVIKKCPALGTLLSKKKDLLNSLNSSRSIKFDVVELSDSIGCQSNIIKRQLKDLQFTSDVTGCRKSGILVEFSDLSFHFQSPGDLTNEEMDGVVDFLFERVERQEATELYHLRNFYDMLESVSYKSCISCQDEIDVGRSSKLRLKLQEHLESSSDIIPLDELKASCSTQTEPGVEMSVRQNVRNFIGTYSSEDRLITGRNIARIFYGIDSPCFPSEIWARVRGFWRSHMDVDFNVIRKIATMELVR